MIDAVKANAKVDARRLFLVGSSQGGYVSAYVAARQSADVRALVLNFPAFCIGDDAKRLVERMSDDACVPEEATIGGLTVGRRYLQDAIETDIFAEIKGYAGDVLIIHGADDEIVPAEYSLRAAKVYGASSQVIMLGGMGHGFRNALPEHYRRAMDCTLDFITSRL